jgi:cellulose synthase (UDP-forming)
VLSGALTALLLLRYTVRRVAATMPPDLGFCHPVCVRIFLLFELTAIVYTMSIQMLVRHRDNRPEADRGGEVQNCAARREGTAVDVFISYNEERSVRKTIIAARAIDYPHLNIWVLTTHDSAARLL